MKHHRLKIFLNIAYCASILLVSFSSIFAEESSTEENSNGPFMQSITDGKKYIPIIEEKTGIKYIRLVKVLEKNPLDQSWDLFNIKHYSGDRNNEDIAIAALRSCVAIKNDEVIVIPRYGDSNSTAFIKYLDLLKVRINDMEDFYDIWDLYVECYGRITSYDKEPIFSEINNSTIVVSSNVKKFKEKRSSYEPTIIKKLRTIVTFSLNDSGAVNGIKREIVRED